MPSSTPPTGVSDRPSQQGAGHRNGGGEATSSTPINIPRPRTSRYLPTDWRPYFRAMLALPRLVKKMKRGDVEGGKVEGVEIELGKMGVDKSDVVIQIKVDHLAAETVEGGQVEGGNAELDSASERSVRQQSRQKKFKLLGCVAAIGSVVMIGGRILLKSRR